MANELASRDLGCGKLARPPNTERHRLVTQRHSDAGHCLKRGVHSLWKRLLMGLWGRKVNSR